MALHISRYDHTMLSLYTWSRNVRHVIHALSRGCTRSMLKNVYSIMNVRNLTCHVLNFVVIRGAFNNVSARRARGVLVPMCIRYVYNLVPVHRARGERSHCWTRLSFAHNAVWFNAVLSSKCYVRIQANKMQTKTTVHLRYMRTR